MLKKILLSGLCLMVVNIFSSSESRNFGLSHPVFTNKQLNVNTLFTISFADNQAKNLFYGSCAGLPGTLVHVGNDYLRFTTTCAMSSQELRTVVQSLINSLNIDHKIEGLDIGQ